MTTTVRIDKWLWAVRVFKTRSQATEACRAGFVRIDGVRVKASHQVQRHEVISARSGGIVRVVKVLDLLNRRVGAREAVAYMEDRTPDENRIQPRSAGYLPPPLIRPKGTGRPTKRDRRLIDGLRREEMSDADAGASETGTVAGNG